MSCLRCRFMEEVESGRYDIAMLDWDSHLDRRNPKGRFTRFIAREFGLSNRSAQLFNFNPRMSDLAIRVLVNEAKRIETGETPETKCKIKHAKARAAQMEKQDAIARSGNGGASGSGARKSKRPVRAEAAGMPGLRNIALGTSGAHQEPRIGRQ